jgi:predicted membrane protein
MKKRLSYIHQIMLSLVIAAISIPAMAHGDHDKEMFKVIPSYQAVEVAKNEIKRLVKAKQIHNKWLTIKDAEADLKRVDLRKEWIVTFKYKNHQTDSTDILVVHLTQNGYFQSFRLGAED